MSSLSIAPSLKSPSSATVVEDTKKISEKTINDHSTKNEILTKSSILESG